MKPLREYLREQRKAYLTEVLASTCGDTREAARIAGVSLATFYRAGVKQGDLKQALMRNPTFAPPKNSITALLQFFGVNVKRKRGVDFWAEFHDRLDWMYHDAHERYLTLVKRLHPDRPNGNAEQMTIVNNAWRELEKRFRYHGVMC